MSETKTNNTGAGRKLLALGLGGLSNLLIVVALTSVAMIVVLPGANIVELLEFCLSTDMLRADTMMQLGGLLLLIGTLWGALWGAMMFARSRRRKVTVRALRASAGTAATEFIIVLPIFLLFTFGTAQLCINLIAGIQANYAGYQAARTAWLWVPERGHRRSGGGQSVNNTIINERIRIATAAAMTPVASADFMGDIRLNGAAADARGALVFSAVPGGGFLGAGARRSISMGASISTNFSQDMSFTSGFDGNTNTNSIFGLAQRAGRKFTHAWFASQGSQLLERNGEIGARMSYQMHQSMPIVGKYFTGRFAPITGDWIPFTGMAIVGARPGFYMEIRREYTFPAQPGKVNAQKPNNNANGNASGGGAKGALRSIFGV